MSDKSGYAIWIRGKRDDRTTYEPKIDHFYAHGYLDVFRDGDGNPIWFPTREAAERHLAWQYEHNLIKWHLREAYTRMNDQEREP